MTWTAIASRGRPSRSRARPRKPGERWDKVCDVRDDVEDALDRAKDQDEDNADVAAADGGLAVRFRGGRLYRRRAERPHDRRRRFEVPPRGVKKGTKRARQYEHIKKSLETRRSEDTAEEIAARTVNKERARHGEARSVTALRRGHLLGRRGGLRSHRRGPRVAAEGPAVRGSQAEGDQGRSKMTKDEPVRHSEAVG
jgi:hypothetical protein